MQLTQLRHLSAIDPPNPPHVPDAFDASDAHEATMHDICILSTLLTSQPQSECTQNPGCPCCIVYNVLHIVALYL